MVNFSFLVGLRSILGLPFVVFISPKLLNVFNEINLSFTQISWVWPNRISWWEPPEWMGCNWRRNEVTFELPSSLCAAPNIQCNLLRSAFSKRRNILADSNSQINYNSYFTSESAKSALRQWQFWTKDHLARLGWHFWTKASLHSLSAEFRLFLNGWARKIFKEGFGLYWHMIT